MKAAFFILSIATLLAYAECINQVTIAMRKNEVIPDVVSQGPKAELRVKYDRKAVHLGNVLTPTQTKNKPDIVSWKFDNNAFYTLIFTAPDGPSRANPKYREVIKWLVVNIPANNINKGEVLAEYIGAGPSKNAGLARYVFLVYKQKGKQNFDEKPIDKYSFDPRKHFSTRNFTQKYKMENVPVAADFFQARYDSYVPVLYKQVHYNPDS
ncbi:protein D3-like [Eupeodes corollae]|uniref:protein D3-like n=1 Tax=Eupeodes corollae TaxID=290404 RepID=UPI0024927FE9|nr:protein D3-like [Eupeodes corollae]